MPYPYDEENPDVIARLLAEQTPELNMSTLRAPENQNLPMSGISPGMDYTNIKAPDNKERIKQYLAGKSTPPAGLPKQGEDYPYYEDKEALGRAEDRGSRKRLMASLGMALDDITKGASGFKSDSTLYSDMMKDSESPYDKEMSQQNKLRDYLKNKSEFGMKKLALDRETEMLKRTIKRDEEDARHHKALEAATLSNKEYERKKEEQKRSEGTAEERKSAGFMNQMTEADKDLSSIRGQGFEREKSLMASAPDIVKQGLGYVGLTDKNLSANEQAERRFVNATLRNESGAAIGKQEYENAEKQYFPRPGDSPEVIAQKNKNRISKIEDMRLAAGPLGKTQPAAVAPVAQSSPVTAQPPSPAGKVRVINPQGKAGFIPAEQLEEALKSGYTKG